MKNLLYTLLLLVSFQAFSQDITGAWHGFLEIQGMKLNLVFNISKTGDTYNATMDSPDQGIKGIPVESVSFGQSALKITIPMAKIEYTGQYASNGFTGNFAQNGMSFPMNLTREKILAKRPQNPAEPYPYYSENLVFMNKKDNIKLAGTLTLPAKEGHFPVVVLITGSGPQNRDSELLEHKPFLVISDYLTRNGIGVLRFDDRGVAESEGDRAKATTRDFATDVAAAVDYLKTRKEVNPKKIGLIGHSEGGIIAPMVAADTKDVAFIVLLAGPGVPGDEILLQQTYLVGKTAGMTEAELEKASATNKKIYDIVKTVADPQQAEAQLTTLLKANFEEESAGETEKPIQDEMETVIKQQIATITSPWLRFFISYDPSIALKKVKCPVLALNGEKDIQVPAKQNTEAIKNTLEKSGNKKVTAQILPGLNHLFQQCTACSIEEYGKLEETFSPSALKIMTDWIKSQVK